MSRNESTKWSPEVRHEIQRAMNAVVREADDIVKRRSSDGRWLPPGEIDELGSNPALGAAGRIWVLDRLQTRIDEARAVIDRVEREARAESGISPRERRDE
ncbi:hypothetical protein ACWGDX_29675 [Streptomyces sp. NPDC055025]